MRRSAIALAALVLVAAGIAAYTSSFAGVFVFDDDPAIVDNPSLRSLWPPARAMGAPPDTTLSGRPIASLTLAVNYALAAGDHREPWGYHAGNLAIHLLSGLALFGVARRTLLTDRIRDRYGASATGLAFVIALIWLLHPLQTGSVTYVVQRVESLMGLFYLVTLYCAIRAADNRPGEAGPRGSALWTAGAVGACALGMGSKEVMVTAPLIVVLWDWTFAPGRWWRGRWPVYSGLAATWVILAVLVAAGPRTHSVGFGFAAWPWSTYLMTQAGVVAHYLRLAIVPSPLVLDYEWPAALSLADVAPQAAVLLILLGLTIWAVARRMPAGFAGGWFFGILAPTSSVIPIVTEVAAEHRMYLPVAAVISLVVLGAYTLWPRRLPRGALIVTAAALAVALGFLTDARNRDYQSYERIWSDTIQKRPLNARARVNYATALLKGGQYKQAEAHLRVAVQVKPDFAEAQADLGVSLCAQGAFDEGIRHLQQAIAIEPSYSAAHQDLAEAYASQGRLGVALEHYLKALERRPDDVTLLNRAAWILATASEGATRNGAQAATLAERAARLTGRQDVESLDTLAAAYAELGHFGDAVSTGREALTLARAKGELAIVPELERRLALYQKEYLTPMRSWRRF